jgi:outer membrane protein assembly factor BamD
MHLRNACLLLGLAMAVACASGGLRLAGLTADEVLALGLERAENRKWDDAVAALEAFTFQFPAHPRYQEGRYRLGRVYYEKKEFITAAAEFARLADDYPSGEWADDARFAVCESYSRLSPKPPLDQEYTVSAIQHCESLIAYYPESEFVERARGMVAELREKLATKSYLQGEYYYKRKAFDSAILAFNNVLTAYPASDSAPKALLKLLRTYEALGYSEEAKEARERLLRDYPDSEEARGIREVEEAYAP